MKLSQEVPVFSVSADGRAYPRDGARIGPAWAAMWGRLTDGQWHPREELIQAGCAAGEIAWNTAYNLVWQASRRAIVEQKGRKGARLIRAVGK